MKLGLLSEAMFDDLVKNLVVKSRTYLYGLPPEALNSPQLKNLIKSAAEMKLPLTSPATKMWWNKLANYFSNDSINAEQFQTLLKQRIKSEVLDWVKYVNLQSKRIIDHEKTKNATQEPTANGRVGAMRDKAKQIRQNVAGQRTSPETLPYVPTEGILDGVKNVAGKAIDMMVPNRRETVMKELTVRSLNKLIATIAVKRAFELYKELIAKTQGTAQKTTAGAAATPPVPSAAQNVGQGTPPNTL